MLILLLFLFQSPMSCRLIVNDIPESDKCEAKVIPSNSVLGVVLGSPRAFVEYQCTSPFMVEITPRGGGAALIVKEMERDNKWVSRGTHHVDAKGSFTAPTLS